MAIRVHLATILAAILLSTIVQAQWPNWGGGTGTGGRDEDDEGLPAWMSRGRPTSTRSTPSPWGPVGGGNGNGNGNGNGGFPPWWADGPGGGGGNPWSNNGGPWGQRPPPTSTPQPGSRPPTPSIVTITMTRTQTWGGITTTPTQTRPPPSAYTTTRTWTAPSAWGPPRSPFGPQTSTPTGPQTIPTTTTEMPKEPVPFVTICGYTRYVEDDVSNAIIAGCYYKNKTTTVNKSGWPKQFPNEQRFNFGDIKAPYWEFPLINSAAYVGGDPGPDRVVFNTACNLAGELTQNGAGAKVYTECKEQY